MSEEYENLAEELRGKLRHYETLYGPLAGKEPTECPPSVLPLVPAQCLFCGAAWKGGCEVPGKPFPKVGPRIFYDCGASLSVWCDLGQGSVHLLAKGCQTANSSCPEENKGA